MKRKRKNHITVKALIGLCKWIKDPRRPWGHKLHELTDILVITLLAIVCGCEGWEEIRDYAKTKQDWLKTLLPLPNGIPSESTFRRLFAHINPQSLENLYREWVYPYIGSSCGKQICVDGKAVRGVAKRSDAHLHMVSAWIREDRISMGQIRTKEKSNEIKAIPQLLETLNIKGSVITIDAMGCQRDIVKTIIHKESNYVLAVKENQPTLYNEIKEYFEWAMEDTIEYHRLSQYQTTSFDHGRVTHWRVLSTKDTVWFESKTDWEGLQSFVMVECAWKSSKQSYTQRRFYISNLDMAAEQFHRYVRGHWSVENQLHWLLDVAFHEDHCLINSGFAPQNLSLLRKMALAMLCADTSKKASIARKRKMAGWDNDFALQIISTE